MGQAAAGAVRHLVRHTQIPAITLEICSLPTNAYNNMIPNPFTAYYPAHPPLTRYISTGKGMGRPSTPCSTPRDTRILRLRSARKAGPKLRARELPKYCVGNTDQIMDQGSRAGVHLVLYMSRGVTSCNSLEQELPSSVPCGKMPYYNHSCLHTTRAVTVCELRHLLSAPIPSLPGLL
jgi:hypothetical protein